jgi:type IV pilus assembly protein PilE
MRSRPLLRYDPSDRRTVACGFTLIELMIAVAIVAILALIAYPSYSQYPRRSARAEAQSYLSSVAGLQQQYLIDKRAYAHSLTALHAAPAGNVASKFAIAVAADDGPPPSYVVTAQATGDQLKDACPTLAIDSAGNRTPASCW